MLKGRGFFSRSVKTFQIKPDWVNTQGTLRQTKLPHIFVAALGFTKKN